MLDTLSFIFTLLSFLLAVYLGKDQLKQDFGKISILLIKRIVVVIIIVLPMLVIIIAVILNDSMVNELSDFDFTKDSIGWVIFRVLFLIFYILASLLVFVGGFLTLLEWPRGTISTIIIAICLSFLFLSDDNIRQIGRLWSISLLMFWSGLLGRIFVKNK